MIAQIPQCVVAAAGELPDWEELREQGRRIKDRTLARLDEHLLTFEAAAGAAGASVHWARDADEANATVTALMRAAGSTEAVKVKSLTTDEIGLNDALAAVDMHATEADLAELILQLDGDWSSHILVPAIHRNRLHTFLAEACREVCEPQPDPGEDIEVELHPLRDVPRLIAGGEISHALVAVAFQKLDLLRAGFAPR